MLIYIARRLAMSASVILATLVATFLLFFAGPADPALAMCAENRCPESKLADIRSSMGLDRPVPEQFAEYFAGVFTGRDIIDGGNTVHCSAPCLGYSWHSHLEVKSLVLSKMPTTAMLALMTMVVFLSVGVTSGVYAAKRRGSPVDRIVVGFSQVFGSIPYYIVALLFSLYIVIQLGLFWRGASPSDGLGRWILGMVAPALVLGLVTATGYVRYTRAQMVESLNQDFVRTARSKGISETAVTYKHALRAAISPVVTILGLDMAFLLSGTLVTEKIFDLDGVGRLAITSLGLDDLPIIMGTVVLTAVLVVTMNLLVDIAYSFIDPRVRLT